jgi:signal transduction histidine kinase
MVSENVQFAEMISKIAHELRSPLTSVKGFSSTLVRRWDRFTDEQKLQFVETIHSDAERMARIVSEVLDLARLEANRLELHLGDANVAAVAQQAASNWSELPGADRIELDVDDEVTAYADPERLGHVLSNIIENAIKFSDEGPIKVSARSTTDGMVEITVSDQGVGIDDDAIASVFSGPAPHAQRAGPSGTGLGLYLTRRLVEAHNGSIAVESQHGEGSTFIVRLPASQT